MMWAACGNLSPTSSTCQRPKPQRRHETNTMTASFASLFCVSSVQISYYVSAATLRFSSRLPW
eukprot:3191466-Amphidinium_carterae.1